MKRGRRPDFARPDVREEYTRLRDIAQKRIKRGKASGLNTPLMREHYGGFKKLRDMNSAKEFKKEYAALKKFVRSESQTTLKGNKKHYDKVYDKLTAKGGKMEGIENFTRDDLDTFGMFMNLTEVAENETKILGSPDAVVIYASMFLDRNHSEREKKKLLKEYAQTILKENRTNEGKQAVMDIVKKEYKRFGFRTEKGAGNIGKGAKDAHDRYLRAFNKRFGF